MANMFGLRKVIGKTPGSGLSCTGMSPIEDLQLNRRALALCEQLAAEGATHGVTVHTLRCGTRLVDCGIAASGSPVAAVMLARICLAGLADVSVRDPVTEVGPWEQIEVATQQPIAACLASQYAGWEVRHDSYFAMGSGPMRAAAAREPLFADIGYRETAESCVGVLEASTAPPDEVCAEIAAKCGITPNRLTLLVAPTDSLCGRVQIVARSVETALHKLHELGFSLDRINAGLGTAPLPPPAGDGFAALGRTNDSVLYGARVILEVTGDDDSLKEIGPQVPSSASRDYGRPFAEVLAEYEHDFYRVDPLLFSPAWIELANLESGHRFAFGSMNRDVLAKSFAAKQ